MAVGFVAPLVWLLLSMVALLLFQSTRYLNGFIIATIRWVPRTARNNDLGPPPLQQDGVTTHSLPLRVSHCESCLQCVLISGYPLVRWRNTPSSKMHFWLAPSTSLGLASCAYNQVRYLTTCGCHLRAVSVHSVRSKGRSKYYPLADLNTLQRYRVDGNLRRG